MRQRVSALVIQHKKILLVEEIDVAHWSTPGGGIKDGETHEIALRRELQEECGITIDTMDFYLSYIGKNVFYAVEQCDHCYLVTYTGEPKASSAVRSIGRFTKQQILDKSIVIPADYRTTLIPSLIKDELL